MKGSYVVLGFALALASSPLRANQMPESAWRVGLVADPSLQRVAQGFRDSTESYVLFNPILLRRIPPELALYALLHEQAHIALGHKLDADHLVNGDSAGIAPLDSLSPATTALRTERRTLELSADCAVARRILSRAPQLLKAIIQQFREMAESDDTADPALSLRERAENLQACAAAPATRVA